MLKDISTQESLMAVDSNVHAIIKNASSSSLNNKNKSRVDLVLRSSNNNDSNDNLSLHNKINKNDSTVNLIKLNDSTGTLATAAAAAATTTNPAATTGVGVDKNNRNKQAPAVEQSSKSSGDQLQEELFSITRRLRNFPTLNYTGLYDSLVNIIDIVPIIQHNQLGIVYTLKSIYTYMCVSAFHQVFLFCTAIGQALIHSFACLAPFLPENLIESLPQTIALTLITFPRELHKHIVDALCNSIIPIASELTLFVLFLLVIY